MSLKLRKQQTTVTSNSRRSQPVAVVLIRRTPEMINCFSPLLSRALLRGPSSPVNRIRMSPEVQPSIWPWVRHTHGWESMRKAARKEGGVGTLTSICSCSRAAQGREARPRKTSLSFINSFRKALQPGAKWEKRGKGNRNELLRSTEHLSDFEVT